MLWSARAQNRTKDMIQVHRGCRSPLSVVVLSNEGTHLALDAKNAACQGAAERRIQQERKEFILFVYSV